MTTSLRVQATATVDGKQASVELKKLVGELADVKIKTAEQKEEARKLAAELKSLNRETAEGAARATEIRTAMRANQIAMIETGAAANKASQQLAQLSQAAGKAGTSAGQMRAATANLGQQIGDISQGLALGISPMTIFAQQGGQVAFAMSGLSGALGRVGTVLSGPYGAAITGATLILAPFIAKLFETDDAARLAADGTLSFAKEIEVALKPLSAQAKAAFGSLADEFNAAIGSMNDSLPDLSNVIGGALRQIDRINNRVAEATGGGYQRSNLAGQFQSDRSQALAFQRSLAVEKSLNSGPLGKDFVDAVGAKAGRAYQDLLADVAIGTGAVADATRAYKSSEESLERQVKAGVITLGQARAELERRRNAIDAARDATQKATTADREAEQAAKASAEARRKLALETATYFNTVKVPQAGQLAQGEGLDALGRSTDGIAGRLEASGKAAAKAFTASTLADAAIIGQAIGGGLGRAFTGVAALGFGTQNAKGVTGDLTGVGGKLETLLKPLGDTFGNGGKRIAGLIGQAAGGAATGSVISGIGDALGIKNSKVGASIGGAIGSAIPIPGGEIIGSILGGVVGGLFGPKGSTTISATGGKVSSTGTGNAAVQKATGAIGNTITDALQAIADQLGGSIGDFSVSIGKKKGQFRIDRSGTGKLNGSTVTGTDSESEALSLAIADALNDGAIRTSPRVQAALLAYADNVNKAVSEALKVKGLEDLLADRNNPFLAGFRSLETQLKQRLDVAQQYGFDLVEIEKINGEDRTKALKDTLAAATGSVRNLLTDLTIGSGATGSPTQRLAGLTAERDRLTALARGGDNGQLDAISSIVKQIDDLQKETFGSTAGFATGRADSVALLNDLIRQTEDRAKAAAEQARNTAQSTVDKLTELNATGDDQLGVQSEMRVLLADNKLLLQDISSTLKGGSSFGLATSYAR